MTTFLLVAGLVLSVAAGVDQTKDQVVLIKTEDAEMTAAIQHAQATLSNWTPDLRAFLVTSPNM